MPRIFSGIFQNIPLKKKTKKIFKTTRPQPKKIIQKRLKKVQN